MSPINFSLIVIIIRKDPIYLKHLWVHLATPWSQHRVCQLVKLQFAWLLVNLKQFPHINYLCGHVHAVNGSAVSLLTWLVVTPLLTYKKNSFP